MLQMILSIFLSFALAFTGLSPDTETGDRMGQKRFVYIRRDDTPSQPVGLLGAMEAAGRALEPGAGPFVLTQDGDPVGGPLTRVEVLRRLRKRLFHGEVGPTYRIRDEAGDPSASQGSGDGIVFRVREVVPAIKIIDTNGNDKADFYWSALKAEFPDAQFAGAYVCKNIIDNGISQHSFGNAVDAFPGSHETLTQMANWAVAHADETHAEDIIWLQRIWTRGVGERAYTGEFHGHLHEDFAPSFSGSCGVRN